MLEVFSLEVFVKVCKSQNLRTRWHRLENWNHAGIDSELLGSRFDSCPIIKERSTCQQKSHTKGILQHTVPVEHFSMMHRLKRETQQSMVPRYSETKLFPNILGPLQYDNIILCACTKVCVQSSQSSIIPKVITTKTMGECLTRSHTNR